MKQVVILLFSFSALTSQANTHFMQGHWISQNSGSERGFIDVDLDKEAGLLTIVDCLSTKSDSMASCSEMYWRITENDEILFQKNKVGDIFPFRIFIFNAHEQASEAIRLTKINDHSIEYIYSYSNLDGAITHKKALLFVVTTKR